MAIDVHQENCCSLAKAAKLLPVVRGTKPPHPMTLHRWATKGLLSRSGKRIQLETTFVGGTRVTSTEALERFFQMKDDLAPVDVASPTDAAWERRATKAKRVLKGMGML